MAWNEPGPNRDPWSQGPRRGNGPPDLDELLKRLKARFGGKGGGGGAPGSGAGLPSGMMGLLGLVLLGLWLASGFYVVDEQERAVVLRFGQHVGTSDPGLRWHVPWPVEREEVVNVTGVRSVRDQAVMLTRDENIIDVELTVQ
jgi:modulator of FtsH protease HflK